MKAITLFSGSSNPNLAQKIASNMGLQLGKALIGHYSDGEIQIEIEEPIRGKDVYLIQSTSFPYHDHIMELLLMADALRRASAHQIVAVMPYFAYARQDKRQNSNQVPISAKLIADLLSTAGIDRVITVDLHAEQIQGFFSIAVDNLYASKILLQDIQRQNHADIVIVSPDAGGVVRARAYAKNLHCTLAIIDKRRSKPNECEMMQLIGEVQNKTCIIVDDLIDTAGTICQAATALKENGAQKVIAYSTHAVLSGNAVQKIKSSALDELVVTDSIPLNEAARHLPHIRVVSIAALLSDTMMFSC